MNYIGIDVHKAFCQVCIEDTTGREISNEKIPTTREDLNHFLDGIKEGKFVLESSIGWEFVYELIEARGFEVQLAHPLKVKAIAWAKVKTDKIDAKTLCDLLRADLIPRSYVPVRSVRDMRELLRHRISLIGKTTSFKNRIHAELLRRGISRPPDLHKPFSAKARKWLKSLDITTIDSNLACIDAIENEVNNLNSRLQLEYEKNHQAQLLATVDGIGFYTALVFVYEIDNIARFANAEHLCSYVGIVPSVRQSAGKTYYGSISKQGVSHLRWLLIEGTHVHIRTNPDSALSKFYKRLMTKKGKQKAFVATARKLLHIIYWILKTGEKYHSHGYNPGSPPA